VVRDQLEPCHWEMPPWLSTATQNVAVGQLTPVMAVVVIWALSEVEAGGPMATGADHD
jgi:hypothetical protein